MPGVSPWLTRNTSPLPASATAHSGIVTQKRPLMTRGSSAISMVATSSSAKKMTISRIKVSASVEVGQRTAGEGEAEPDPVLFEVVRGVAEVSRRLRLE